MTIEFLHDLWMLGLVFDKVEVAVVVDSADAVHIHFETPDRT